MIFVVLGAAALLAFVLRVCADEREFQRSLVEERLAFERWQERRP